MLNNFHDYLIVGGMPNNVSNLIDDDKYKYI